jgi:hypothetical protein
MPTPVVDHGSNIAISAAARSTLRIRTTGSWLADQMAESHEMPACLPAASVITILCALQDLVARV